MWPLLSAILCVSAHAPGNFRPVCHKIIAQYERPHALCPLTRFKLLGCMMAKALHDGRPFPLRISYALARCICGHVLEFDDLATILNFHFFDVRPYFFCAMVRFVCN